MKEHTRTIIGLAIFYLAVVAIADFFLAKIPIINWLALAFVFLFFTVLITSSLVGLLAKGKVPAEQFSHKDEDELERLARVVENALVEEDSESLKVLEKRLTALARIASGYRTGSELQSTAEHGPQSLPPVEEDLPKQTPTARPLIPMNLSSREIENLLSMIEGWLG